jgi:hypothetical protein
LQLQTEIKFQIAIPINTISIMSTQPLPDNYPPMPMPQMPHMPYFLQQTYFPMSSMYGGYIGQPVPGMMPGVNLMHSMYGHGVPMMTNTMPYPPSMTSFGYPIGPYYGHMTGSIPGSAGTTVSSVSPCQNHGFSNMGFNPLFQNMAHDMKTNIMAENKPTTVGPQNITTHTTVLDPQGRGKTRTKANKLISIVASFRHTCTA